MKNPALLFEKYSPPRESSSELRKRKTVELLLREPVLFDWVKEQKFGQLLQLNHSKAAFFYRHCKQRLSRVYIRAPNVSEVYLVCLKCGYSREHNEY